MSNQQNPRRGRSPDYDREQFADGEWHYIEHFKNKASWIQGSYRWARQRGMFFEYRSADLGRPGIHVRFWKEFQDVDD